MAKTLNKNRDISDMIDSFSEAASVNLGRVFIIPGKDGFAVKKEGALKASLVLPTEAEALEAANNLKPAGNVVVVNSIKSNKSK